MTHENDYCTITRTAFSSGYGLHPFHQQGVVGRIVGSRTGETRTVNPGRAVEGIDLDTGIVGERRQAGKACRVACFDNRVLDESGSGFGYLADAIFGLGVQLVTEIIEYDR